MEPDRHRVAADRVITAKNALTIAAVEVLRGEPDAAAHAQAALLELNAARDALAATTLEAKPDAA